jgi:hypothetical protein
MCVPDAISAFTRAFDALWQRERAPAEDTDVLINVGAREWCAADPGPPRTSLWRSRVCSARGAGSMLNRKGFGRAALRAGHTNLAPMPWRGWVGARLRAPGWGEPHAQRVGVTPPRAERSPARDPPPPGEGGSPTARLALNLNPRSIFTTCLVSSPSHGQKYPSRFFFSIEPASS